jgi:hypothetical protein
MRRPAVEDTVRHRGASREGSVDFFPSTDSNRAHSARI